MRNTEVTPRAALAGDTFGAWKWSLRTGAVEPFGPTAELFGLTPGSGRTIEAYAGMLIQSSADRLMGFARRAGDENVQLDLRVELRSGRCVHLLGSSSDDDPSVLAGISFDVSEQLGSDHSTSTPRARLPVLLDNSTRLRNLFELEYGARKRLHEFLNLSKNFHSRRALELLKHSRRALISRESERSRNFLLRLTDALRMQNDPARIADTACAMLRRQLGDAHVVYWEREEGDRAVATAESAPSSEPSMLGRGYRFGKGVAGSSADVAEGDTLWCDDVSLVEPLSSSDRAFDDGGRVASWAIAPLIKRLRLRAMLTVFRNIPHEWTVEELRLLEGAIERTWHAIERVQAENALRESETRYRLTVEGARDYAFIVLANDGVVTSWSAGARAIFGYDTSEAVGMPIDFVFTTQQRETSVPRRELAEARRGAVGLSGWRVRKDGARIYVEGTMRPLPSWPETERSLIMIVKDVTKQRRVERALVQSDARYRMLVENVTDYAIVLLDPSGAVQEWTSGAESMFGYTAHEMRGRPVTALIPSGRGGDLDTALRKAAAAGRIAFEAMRVRKNGTRFWADEVLTAVHDQDDTLVGFSLIARDLTERRRAAHIAERQRRAFERDALRRRLALAEEEERRRLSRELHDGAGQHLTAIGFGLRAISSSLEPGSAAERQAGLLAELVNNLSRELHDLAIRLRPKALDDFGLDAALETYIDEWSRGSQVSVDFRSRLIGERLAPGIESALYRIVGEALTNVGRHAEARNVGIVLERRDDHICLTIGDDGHGFDDSFPGSTAENAPGLGLASMRERAELFNGTFEIESSAGSGTTLFIRVPLTSATIAGGD